VGFHNLTTNINPGLNLLKGKQTKTRPQPAKTGISKPLSLRVIQRSPRPGAKQNACQIPWQDKISGHRSLHSFVASTSPKICYTDEKVNLLSLQVNTYFGNVPTKISQKQNLFLFRTNADPSRSYQFKPLRPVAAIQRPILNRLRNMLHRNILFPSQIRYRPCYLQDTIMRSGA
jgi:hypothetical protein